MDQDLGRFENLERIIARLRAPDGCPWDREQTHATLKPFLIEESYEVLQALDDENSEKLCEELGDLLLQILLHAQISREAGEFDMADVTRGIATKLIRRHPHVFGDWKVKDVDQVWANWEKIKRAEKHGTHRARPSALDGIPKHLPALQRAEKLIKKARKARLLRDTPTPPGPNTRSQVARQLLALARYAQTQGWSAEDLLRQETRRFEAGLRRRERTRR